VVKHVGAVELRVFVAAVLAVATDAVLAAQHILKIGAHLATSLARLHVQNIARRSRLEAGSKREKKGGKERRNVRNSVRQFGTGNRKCRWHVYPE
jgi:type IV secretory pathway TrbF-like protein